MAQKALKPGMHEEFLSMRGLGRNLNPPASELNWNSLNIPANRFRARV